MFKDTLSNTLPGFSFGNELWKQFTSRKTIYWNCISATILSLEKQPKIGMWFCLTMLIITLRRWWY